MSFNINYLLFCGDILTVASSEASEPAVLIIDDTKKEQSITFKIPCPDDLVALKVSEIIKNKFDHDEVLSFLGMPPKSGFVTVITSYEHFLSEAVEE